MSEFNIYFDSLVSILRPVMRHTDHIDMPTNMICAKNAQDYSRIYGAIDNLLTTVKTVSYMQNTSLELRLKKLCETLNQVSIVPWFAVNQASRIDEMYSQIEQLVSHFSDGENRDFDTIGYLRRAEQYLDEFVATHASLLELSRLLKTEYNGLDKKQDGNPEVDYRTESGFILICDKLSNALHKALDNISKISITDKSLELEAEVREERIKKVLAVFRELRDK